MIQSAPPAELKEMTLPGGEPLGLEECRDL
jgi:hypothetical protein